jgi:hypothetical protein
MLPRYGLAKEIHVHQPFRIGIQNELPRVATLRDMMGNINCHYAS